MRATLIALVTSLLLAAPPALAQPEGKVDIETSRKAIGIGKRALEKYEAEAYDEAYTLFAEADALVHSPTFTLYMARCRRGAGKLKEALVLYEEVAQEALPESAPDPWKAAQSEAKTEAKDVAQKVPRILINVRTGELSVAQLDGTPIDHASPIEANPGAYTLVLRSKDGATERREINLEPGRELVIEVDFGSPPSAPSPEPAPTPSLVPLPLPPPPPPPEAEPIYWPGGVALGVGGAGLLVGTVLGVVASGRASSFEEAHCVQNSCSPASEDQANGILQLAHGSTGALVAGGVLSAVGVVLLIVPPTEESSVHVQAGLSGVTVRAHF